MGCGDCGCASYVWNCPVPDEGGMTCEENGSWGPGDVTCGSKDCSGEDFPCDDPGQPAVNGTYNGQIVLQCCGEPC
jgi:hypothetical protein